MQRKSEIQYYLLRVQFRIFALLCIDIYTSEKYRMLGNETGSIIWCYMISFYLV